MNSRKTSISHVMNDNTVSNASDHHYQQQQQHQSTSGACSLKNILQSDDGPSSHVQHASSSQHSQPPPPPQQYNHGGAGNSGSGGNNTVGYGGSYSNEQQARDYYHHPRSHQPLHSQSSHNQEQNNQSFSRDDEASSILLLLSNQTTQPSVNPNYMSSRDHYPQKDNEQMSDVVEAATSLSNISNISKSNSQLNQRPRAKSNTMSIASLCGDESGSSESGHSIPSGSSMDTSQQKYQQSYPEDMRNGDINAHHQHNIVDYNSLYNHNRKHIKKPSSGSTPSLVVNTNPKIPQKEPKVIQKRGSPQKRRPSEPNEFVMRPKIHHSNHFSHGPPTSNGVKLTELREQLGEERNVNRIAQIAPITSVQAGMEWDRSQHSQPYHQTRSSHNVPPQSEIRYHQPPISKSGGSPSMHGDSQKLNYMNSNDRQPKTSPTGPHVHVPNGYPHGPVGGMVGAHQDVQPPQSSQQPSQMPPLRGQHSAFSNQFHKKYNDMKHDPKMKRNAPHAYISYMIYTNQMETGKGKDGHLQSQPPQNNIQSRQIIPNGIPNGSPPLNDHGMVNPSMVSHHQPQVNGGNMGNMYGTREPPHAGYPPIQPASTGYMHPSEAINPAQSRRVSDPPMHSHPNVNAISGSRNPPHGYPPTHVNGPSVEEHQPPPQITHRHSISHNSPPSLLPTHSSSANPQRHILPNLLPATNQHQPQRHVPNPTSPSTSRAGNISQIQTALPPIQSNPSHLQSHHHHHNNNSHAHHHHHYPQEHQNHQNHAHHGHSHTHYHHQPVSQPSQPPPPPTYMSGPPAPLAPQHSYGGKSSPVVPQIPQSPPPPSLMNSSRPPNHYHHTSQQGPPQGGSNRLSSHHHHHHHHHPPPPPSEPVGPPVNSNPPSSNILSQPLTSFLDSRSQYGNVHQHPHHLHHSTNGIGPGPVHIAPLGTPVPRGAPNAYY